MFLAESRKDAVRRVLLLPRRISIFFQNPVDELLQVEIVPVLTNPEKGLVKGRKPLLSIQYKKGVLLAAECRRSLEFAGGENSLGIASFDTNSAGTSRGNSHPATLFSL